MPIQKTTISIRVHPNAARNEIVGFADDILRVKIAAPPLKGRANKELLSFLCQLLAVRSDRVSISKGYTARNKTIAIDGMSKESALGLLLTGQDT
jgi:uncharacterized protein (TIGR00251 family)